ncbi:hypothetical protein DOY81_011681 [Sarcophaga bullata]|nr:hypothetical protein DOY81_011681 [Sarcophaga bullata]
MDAEEEMIEEHLDEEYQTSEIDEELAEYQKQIEELEMVRLKIKHDREMQQKLEKAIKLLHLHIHNYQRIVVFNRRRARQRFKRRQCSLRNFFLQSLMDMQIRFVEMLPLAVEPHLLMGLKPNLLSSRNACNTSNKSEEDVISFYKDVASNFTDGQWLDIFHMPKHIFNTISSRLKPLLEGQLEMDFQSWLAMCIYAIATGNKFISVELFLQVFCEDCLSMPENVQELEKISQAFHRASNMLPCVGVVHIFELPDKCSCERYKCCRTECVIVQVCIDDRLLFRKVEIMNQTPDIFLQSINEINCIWKKISSDSMLPYFMAAPPNFPLRSWLMQKYDNPREIWQHTFNKSFDNLNVFREVAMKTLFGRWQILCSTECIPPDKKSSIIKACCVLHNILEDSGECFLEEWSQDTSRFRYQFTPNVTKSFKDSDEAIEKRDIIAKLIKQYEE